jgi:hypothetical protein
VRKHRVYRGVIHWYPRVPQKLSICPFVPCYGSLAMRVALFAVVLCFGSIRLASAQSCPKENPHGPSIMSSAQTLSGQLVYHNGLRQWLGLQLDSPVCSQKEIQLLPAEEDRPHQQVLNVLRGCRVSTHGPLDISGTGYYSTDIFQTVDKIEAAPGCIRQPAFPDYSKAKPDPSIHSYRVSMRIDYPGDRITISVRSGDRVLTPWLAYADYLLTGGFVFYAHCADGFDLTKFSGTPAAKPDLIAGNLAFDPESAAQRHVTHLRLDYTCRR